jgi:hypothetical protein
MSTKYDSIYALDGKSVTVDGRLAIVGPFVAEGAITTTKPKMPEAAPLVGIRFKARDAKGQESDYQIPVTGAELNKLVAANEASEPLTFSFNGIFIPPQTYDDGGKANA